MDKLDLLILSQDPSVYSVRRLLEESKKIHLKTQALDFFSSAIACSEKPAALIPRIGRRQFDLCLSQLSEWESLGYKPVNTTAAFKSCHHKFNLLNKIKSHQIPHVQTFSVGPTTPWPEIPFPWVMKAATSSQGRFVQLIENKSQAEVFKQELLSLNFDVLVQPFHSDSAGRDLRVFLLGDDFWCYERHNPQDFRSNIHLGGVPVPIKARPEIIQITEKIKNIFKLDIAGIDFLTTSQGPLILEVNACPGFEGLEKVYSDNIARFYIELAIQKTFYKSPDGDN